MHERDYGEDSDNEKISLNNNELEKELLENPSINNMYNMYSKDSNSINSNISEIN